MAPTPTTASPVIRPGAPVTAGHAKRVRAERATHDERAAAGKAVRHVLPLAAHAETTRGARADPVAVLLESQAATRVPQLVPIRYGRMLATPFTFFRGAAAIMAADLGSTPHSGLMVQLCGDAHLSNFGFYSTPERNQAFDINDFDETYPGPFEWDVKRLAASVAVASLVEWLLARRSQRPRRWRPQPAYRQEIRRLAPLGNLDVWYSHQDIAALLKEIRKRVGSPAQRHLNAGLAKAQVPGQQRRAAQAVRHRRRPGAVQERPAVDHSRRGTAGRLGRGRRTLVPADPVVDRGLPGGPAERPPAPARPVRLRPARLQGGRRRQRRNPRLHRPDGRRRCRATR